ncbi:MAG: hypothetical protein H7145_22705, partial [Akkermansiaceae bacterium]|nr:hypothetical protein [Armatimonadota bacterium]
KPGRFPTPVAIVSTKKVPPGAAGIAVARSAYARGDYKAAESAAKRVVAGARTGGRERPVLGSVSVASARHIMAFAAARQGDLKTARIRFAEAREEAEALPPQASPSPVAPGESPQPTLAEDSAYQHAACTMGLGDKAGAERELVQFVRDFPESPLVHGAMRRIARLHGGDIPKDAEAVWKEAQAVQRKSQEERDRQAAMCGPEAVAELLRRRGEVIPLETLAGEIGTAGNGSSFAAMQRVMRGHGFPEARGVRLTAEGLRRQVLPVVALVQPGHFVLVEKIAPGGSVTIWDSSDTFIPPGEATARSKTRVVPAGEWQRIWTNTALTTAPVVGGGDGSKSGVRTKSGVGTKSGGGK